MYDLIRTRLQESLALDDDVRLVFDDRPLMPLPIERLAAFYVVTDEALIDMGMGTPEMIERDRLRSAELQARSHSWRGRVRSLRYRWYEVRHRMDHAANALRGIDCERDW